MSRRARGIAPPLRHDVAFEDVAADVESYILDIVRPLVAYPAEDATIRRSDEPDIEGDVTHRFYVYTDAAVAGYVIGTGGSTANAIRALARTYTSLLGCGDNVDVRVMRGRRR